MVKLEDYKLGTDPSWSNAFDRAFPVARDRGESLELPIGDVWIDRYIPHVYPVELLGHDEKSLIRPIYPWDPYVKGFAALHLGTGYRPRVTHVAIDCGGEKWAPRMHGLSTADCEDAVVEYLTVQNFGYYDPSDPNSIHVRGFSLHGDGSIPSSGGVLKHVRLKNAYGGTGFAIGSSGAGQGAIADWLIDDVDVDMSAVLSPSRWGRGGAVEVAGSIRTSLNLIMSNIRFFGCIGRALLYGGAAADLTFTDVMSSMLRNDPNHYTGDFASYAHAVGHYVNTKLVRAKALGGAGSGFINVSEVGGTGVAYNGCYAADKAKSGYEVNMDLLEMIDCHAWSNLGDGVRLMTPQVTVGQSTMYKNQGAGISIDNPTPSTILVANRAGGNARGSLVTKIPGVVTDIGNRWGSSSSSIRGG